MLNRYRRILESALTRILGDRLHLDPNALTLMGLLVAGIAVLSSWLGASPLMIAALILASSTLDVLDGYVARRGGLVTPFGAFLDSTTDRVCDAAFTASLALSGILGSTEALLLLTAEYMVSYARARAEALGVGLKGVGLMERGERVILKVLALTLSAWSIEAGRVVAWLLILLTSITALHRIVKVHAELRQHYESPKRGDLDDRG